MSTAWLIFSALNTEMRCHMFHSSFDRAFPCGRSPCGVQVAGASSAVPVRRLPPLCALFPTHSAVSCPFVRLPARLEQAAVAAAHASLQCTGCGDHEGRCRAAGSAAVPPPQPPPPDGGARADGGVVGWWWRIPRRCEEVGKFWPVTAAV